MIGRVWRGQTTSANAEAYCSFVTTKVFPALGTIPGHRGAYLLRRNHQSGVEFLVITLWDSMQAVRQFAGDDPEKAVVEPEARAVLSNFDDFVRHYEIVRDSAKD